MSSNCLIVKFVIYALVAILVCFGCKSLDLCSELIEAIVAVVAFIAALIEYVNHQKRAEAQTLSYFNEKYSNDKNVRRVVKWCIYNMPGNDEDIVKPDNYCKEDMLYEKEMFLRFFEELEVSLEKGNLTDEYTVYKMFAYYAIRVSRFEGFVGDYKAHQDKTFLYCKDNEKDWIYFEKFIHRMSRFYQEEEKQKQNNRV